VSVVLAAPSIVKDHEILPTGGLEICPLVAMKDAR
jgi:hypothetical protein